MTSPDFDTLSKLYKENPEEFERVTTQMKSDFINSIEDPIRRKRCEGIQFQLDRQLSKYKDPIARMNEMVKIFWRGTFEFQDALNGKLPLVDETQNAKIIEFKRK